MSKLKPVTDHVERGLSNLIEQYKGRPRMEAWVRSKLKEVQALSDAAWDVLVSRLVDDAVGVQLDVLGKIVGEERAGRDDETYRLFIMARVRVNRSRGRPIDTSEVLNIIAEGIPRIVAEYYPAAIGVELKEEPRFPAAMLFELLRRTKAGGVALNFVSPTTTPDKQFLWGDAGDPDVYTRPSDHGFGDVDGDGDWGLLSDGLSSLG